MLDRRTGVCQDACMGTCVCKQAS